MWGLAVLIAAELFLAPVTFDISPGERVAVEFRQEGAALDAEQLRDCGLVTEAAIYNILNLRSAGAGLVTGDVTIKGPGTSLLYVRRGDDSAKSLLNSGDPTGLHNRVLGLPLEIVADRNPYAMRPGERLPLRVLASGRHASEARIVLEGSPEMRADADGAASVVLEQGLHRIAARFRGAVATLTFEIKAEPASR